MLQKSFAKNSCVWYSINFQGISFLQTKGPFTQDGVGTIHGDGAVAVKMGIMVPSETIYM